jgi:hypothetical protein
MPTFHYSFNCQSDLNAALQRFQDAGIDPAFDSDMEELERQFQELRFTSATE